VSAAFRLLCYLIFLCGQMISQYASADLQAFVDRSTILESQTIEFTLRASSQGDPDFSVLEEQFRILGSRTNSQYQSINGRVSSWIDWNLTLEPLTTGELTIPTIRLNSESSNPIKIQVNALDPKLRAAIQSLVFFETDVSANSVYVQAQLIFTRKLYYARGAQLYGETPGSPEIKNAVVRTITAASPVAVDISGRPYTLIEQKYAIFPERSGQLIIPASAASGNVRLRAQPGFVGGRTRIRAVSESLEITVKPIPASYPSSMPWLPASEVNIVDAWSDQPENLIVGIPVTRTVMVQARASVGSIIPPLQLKFPQALRAYPQAPEISEHSALYGLTGLRKEEYSISAQRSGSINIPAIELTWWDTDTDEVKIARIPEQKIQVALNPAVPVSRTAEESTSTPDPEVSTQPEQTTKETENDLVETALNTWRSILAQVYIPVLLLIGLILVGWYFSGFSSIRKAFSAKSKPALERKLFKQLESVIHQQDLKLLKTRLTEWLSVFHDMPQYAVLQKLDEDDVSHQLIAALNRGIYASSLDKVDTTQIIADVVQRAKEHRKNRRLAKSSAARTQNTLPALFPVGPLQHSTFLAK